MKVNSSSPHIGTNGGFPLRQYSRGGNVTAINLRHIPLAVTDTFAPVLATNTIHSASDKPVKQDAQRLSVLPVSFFPLEDNLQRYLFRQVIFYIIRYSLNRLQRPCSAVSLKQGRMRSFVIIQSQPEKEPGRRLDDFPECPVRRESHNRLQGFFVFDDSRDPAPDLYCLLHAVIRDIKIRAGYHAGNIR